METHWTQTAHLERRWGVVREAPNVAANLPAFFVLLGLFWGSFGVPWDPFSLPPSPQGQPFGSHLAPLGVSWGQARKLDDFGTPLGLLLGSLF